MLTYFPHTQSHSSKSPLLYFNMLAVFYFLLVSHSYFLISAIPTFHFPASVSPQFIKASIPFKNLLSLLSANQFSLLSIQLPSLCLCLLLPFSSSLSILLPCTIHSLVFPHIQLNINSSLHHSYFPDFLKAIPHSLPSPTPVKPYCVII